MKPVSEERIVFGRVIAEREYRVGREKVLLQIGTPHEASWKRDFYCPIRLVRDGNTTLKWAFGGDAVQALQLALQLSRVLLQTSSPRITWDGGQAPGDVGIEKTIFSAYGLEFTRDLERRVDEAVLERGRELERRHKAKEATARKGARAKLRRAPRRATRKRT